MARTRQPNLPGEDFEPSPAVKEITPFADSYEEARDARIAMSGPEKEAKKNLIQAMRSREVQQISLTDGRQVIVTDKLNVKIEKPGGKSKKYADDEIEEEGEE